MADIEEKNDAQKLLDSDLIHQIEKLDIASRKILHGKMYGERRSKQRGQSVEFADYRNYVVGDDLRFIDWNLYARLDKLFLRLFMEEQDLAVNIILDASSSMCCGEPEKLLYAKKLAATLGYIALVKQNRLNLYAYQHDKLYHKRGLRGRFQTKEMIDFLENQTPDIDIKNTINLAKIGKKFAMLEQASSVTILISDMMDKGDTENNLKHLGGMKHDVYVVQLLSPQEIDPAKYGIAGEITFEDIEDGDVAEISLTPDLIKQYKANLRAYCTHIQKICQKRRMTYVLTNTTVSLRKFVLNDLRMQGLLR